MVVVDIKKKELKKQERKDYKILEKVSDFFFLLCIPRAQTVPGRG